MSFRFADALHGCQQVSDSVSDTEPGAVATGSTPLIVMFPRSQLVWDTSLKLAADLRGLCESEKPALPTVLISD